MGVPILDTLRAAGLRIEVNGEHLVVAPKSAITPELRRIIRDNKPVILNALADDRRHCATCANLDGKRCGARQCLVMDDIPRRCFDYQPKPQDHDQRPGCERWPSLEPEVEP